MPKSTTKRATRRLCPAPDCGELVTDQKSATYDLRERPWHQACALRALSSHFRTPLDLEVLAGQRVEFEIPGEHAVVTRRDSFATANFRVPRDFILYLVELSGDVGVYSLFVGSSNAFCYAPAPENAAYAGDLEGGRLVIAPEYAFTGVDITIHLLLDRTPEPKLRLVGELFDPKARSPRSHKSASLACFGLDTQDAVEPDGTAEVCASPVVPTLFERVAVDDWGDWVVEQIKVACFPGDARGETEAATVHRALTGRVTPLPTFTVRPGESLRILVRNRARSPRRFCGRLYGTGNRDQNR